MNTLSLGFVYGEGEKNLSLRLYLRVQTGEKEREGGGGGQTDTYCTGSCETPGPERSSQTERNKKILFGLYAASKFPYGAEI